MDQGGLVLKRVLNRALARLEPLGCLLASPLTMADKTKVVVCRPSLTQRPIKGVLLSDKP